MSYQRSVGNRLRYHMSEAGLTTNDCAQSLGVTTISVQRHMRGETAPSLEQLSMYAALFGVRADDLLPRLDSNQQPTGTGIAA